MIGKVVEKSGGAWYNGFIKADNLPDKSEFNAHLKNENSQKRSHKTVMKGCITYE